MMKYKDNPRLVVVYCFFRYFMFFTPILTPFLLANSISYSQIFFLHFVFGLSVLLLEVPFGYITDRVGRKVALVFSSVLMSIALIAFGLGNVFAHFVVAEILLALGYSFYSGTYNAILYDSLLHTRQVADFKRWTGYAIAAQRGAEIVAAGISVYIVLLGMQMTFFFSIAPLMLAIPVILSMKEPLIKEEPIGIGHWHHFGKVVKDAYDHPGIFWFSVYSSIIGGTMLAAIWIFQSLWTTYDIALTSFSLMWVIVLISSGIGSLSAFELEKRLGLHFSLVGLILFMFLGLALSALLPLYSGLIFMCLCTFLWGFSVPVLHDAINNLVQSSRRATVLSIKSMLTRLIQVIFTFFISVVLVQFALTTSLLLLAGILGLVGGYSLYRLHALDIL